MMIIMIKKLFLCVLVALDYQGQQSRLKVHHASSHGSFTSDFEFVCFFTWAKKFIAQYRTIGSASPKSLSLNFTQDIQC